MPEQHFSVECVAVWFDAMAEYTQVRRASATPGEINTDHRWHLLPTTRLAKEWIRAAACRENTQLRIFDEKISTVSVKQYGFPLAVLLPLDTATSGEQAQRAAERQSERLMVFYRPALELYRTDELNAQTARELYYRKEADIL